MHRCKVDCRFRGAQEADGGKVCDTLGNITKERWQGKAFMEGPLSPGLPPLTPGDSNLSFNGQAIALENGKPVWLGTGRVTPFVNGAPAEGNLRFEGKLVTAAGGKAVWLDEQNATIVYAKLPLETTAGEPLTLDATEMESRSATDRHVSRVFVLLGRISLTRFFPRDLQNVRGHVRSV